MFSDFNIDYHSTNRKWWNLVTLYFYQLVTLPTRVTKYSRSIIDHIYVSNPNYFLNCHVPAISLSDHYPVCITRRYAATHVKKNPSIIKYRSFTNFNEASF